MPVLTLDYRHCDRKRPKFIKHVEIEGLATQARQQLVAGGVDAATTATRIVSAVGVGPHQRVVTVEVGPQDARVWLTLGVTAQSITCLHTIAVASSDPVAPGRAGGQLTTATVPESGQ